MDKSEIVLELILALIDKGFVSFGNTADIDNVSKNVSTLYNSLYQSIQSED